MIPRRVINYKLSRDGKLALWAETTPKDWANETKDRLIALGCSKEYAGKVARRIAAATPV
jgi:hypothetical protein